MAETVTSSNIVESIKPSIRDVLLQKTRIISVVVKVFSNEKNSDNTVRIEGECIDGSFNLTASSPIRRTCSLKFKTTTSNLPDKNSPFWINKKFSVDMELKDLTRDDTKSFPIGVYILEDPSINLTFTENIISIKGVDRMALYTGEISGALLPEYLSKVVIEPTKTDSATPFHERLFVHQAIEKTMKLAMENIEHISGSFPISIKMPQKPDPTSPSSMIDDVYRYQIIPYKIDKKVGDTYYSIIKELVEMDYSAQVYFDVDGTFVFSRVPNENIDLTEKIYAWDFEKYNVAQSIDREIKYSNVKNNFVIYGGITGKQKEDKELLGIQVSYNVRLRNGDKYNSPYIPEVLGEDFTRDLIIRENSYVGSPTVYDLAKELNKIDSDIEALTLNDFEIKNLNEVYTTPSKKEKLLKTLKYAKQLCKNRAEQEIYLHQNASEIVKISCLPLYHLDVNELIYVKNSEAGVVGSFVIKEISCGLSPNSLMTITAHKIFNDKN